METKFFNLKFIFIVIFSILFHSCSQDNKDQCKDCTLKEPNLEVKVNLLNNDLQFSKYEAKPNTNSPLLSLNTNFKTKLYDLISSNNVNISGYDLSKINNDNLAAIVIFSDSNDENLMFSEIDRLLIYVKISSNCGNGFRTFLFKKENNSLQIQPEYSFRTNYFSSNDIYDFQTISSPNKNSHSYLLINKELINPISQKPADLQLFLKKKLNSGLSERQCYMPCDSSQGVCIVKGAGADLEGNWSCSAWVSTIEDETFDEGCICCEKRINKTINNEVNYPSSDILFTSYNFKYYFLENSTKGKKYIEMYYKISEQMNDDLMNFDFAVLVYNTIKNNVLPICNELMNNSKSNEILITESRYDTLLNKINYLDQNLNNPSSSEILNVVRTDLSNYKNKSILYVYNSFQD